MYEKMRESKNTETTPETDRPMTREAMVEVLKKLFIENTVETVRNRGVSGFTDVKCREKDPEIFFASQASDEAKEAIATCVSCADKIGCAALAMVNNEPFAILGGLLPADRKEIARSIPALRQAKKMRRKPATQD